MVKLKVEKEEKETRTVREPHKRKTQANKRREVHRCIPFVSTLVKVHVPSSQTREDVLVLVSGVVAFVELLPPKSGTSARTPNIAC